MSSISENTSGADAETSQNPDEYEERIIVLQLDGVLDFDAVKRAAQNGAIRVRESNTDTPLVQVGSSLYSAEWTQTLGTDLLFCIDENAAAQTDLSNQLRNWNPRDQQLQLNFVATSDTRLLAKKVLLTTETDSMQDTQLEGE